MPHRLLVPLLILVVAVSAALGGCGFLDEETEEFNETYPAPAGTRVDVDNDSGGNVAITGWAIDHVEVFATEKTTWGESELEKVEIQVTSREGSILIETIVTGKNVRVSVDYIIKVPNDAIVGTVETSNGRVDLQGVSGNITVTASNGGIYAEDLSGRLTATTSNGRIEVDGVSGGGVLTTSNAGLVVKNSGDSITATTTNGDILVEDSTGDVVLNSSDGAIRVKSLDGYVSAKTSNGAVKITGATGIVTAETSNGSLTAEISNIQPDGTTIKTTNGSIVLYVSPDLDAAIEMKATSGEISVHPPLELTASSPESDYWLVRLGEGGPKMYVEAVNGDLDLYKLEVG